MIRRNIHLTRVQMARFCGAEGENLARSGLEILGNIGSGCDCRVPDCQEAAVYEWKLGQISKSRIPTVARLHPNLDSLDICSV
jgi:hypothetical protein